MTVDELKELVRGLNDKLDKQHQDSQEITGKIADLEASNAERARASDRLRTVVICLIVAVAAAALFIWRFDAYTACGTDRARALAGPGNDRVSFLIAAFKASALSTDVHLAASERQADLATLRKERVRFPAIPKDPALAGLPDSEVLVLVDAIKSIDANDAYGAASKRHPVCSLWPF